MAMAAFSMELFRENQEGESFAFPPPGLFRVNGR